MYGAELNALVKF